MWEDLELDPERIPLFKLVFHSLQILFAFVLWCLEIAVFRAEGSKIVGNNGWTFAAVWASPRVTHHGTEIADMAPSSSSPYRPGSTS